MFTPVTYNKYIVSHLVMILCVCNKEISLYGSVSFDSLLTQTRHAGSADHTAVQGCVPFRGTQSVPRSMLCGAWPLFEFIQ